MATRSGVPDVFLPVPHYGMHGHWLELKLRSRRTTPEQNEWPRDFVAKGYPVRVAYSWSEARDCILEYLGARST